VIHCSLSAALFSSSTRLLARSAKDYHKHSKLVSSTSTKTSSRKVHHKQTNCQRVVDGHNAGPQGLHILVVLADIILPRGVIPVNFPSW
jgi:hypothetical protein